MEKNTITEKIAGATGSISGATSILGSWQVCHNICLGLIALLSVIGVTLTGMPLLFFTKIAIPMWIVALMLLGVVLYFYFAKHCISKNLILVNSGLIIAGTPFKFVHPYKIYLWIIGGSLVILGVGFFLKEKFSKDKMCKHE
jgi:hypothetical protein